jgi:hypothetical protein
MTDEPEFDRKRMVCIRPIHNAHGKKDVAGAFRPELRRFMREVCTEDSVEIAFDNRRSMTGRRAEVLVKLNELDASEDEIFDGVAIFCHGWRRGIQAGFTLKQVDELADAIHRLCAHSMTAVPLYCCSTGDDKADRDIEAAGTGDESFADELRDALCARGANLCRVMAHTTKGHTTRNPSVLFFDGMGSSEGGVGGYAPVRPSGRLWKRWRRALRSSDLRFRFPFLTVEQIHRELAPPTESP